MTAGGPQAGPVLAGCADGAYGWGWRDKVETVSGAADIEVRRLGIVDERGVAVRDVSDVAALVVPLLRVGPPVDVGAGLSDLVGFVSSLADPDVLVHGVDYSLGCSEALCPPDGSSWLDDQSAAGGERQTHPDASLPSADEPWCVFDELWSGVLGYGSVDDGATGSDVWSHRG